MKKYLAMWHTGFETKIVSDSKADVYGMCGEVYIYGKPVNLPCPNYVEEIR